ncbi:hypothetical protein [Myxococcus sp. AS-1-15]|uniref:hypothetical protein n=1 Tax=Myxococcus sp. AS-1-15 TaxID=2874600 RepID=UPI001CBCDEC2|nr:hypothetical protein [Myxococcus sp. AS-1-15]MBZ4400387.1 hypothetical protein [Myxococcus sp. AS-1-15]
MSTLPLSPALERLIAVIRNHGLSTRQVAQLEAVARTLREDSPTSPPDWAERLEAIRARHAAATRGPWRWFGYLRTREVGLHAPGMRSVMEFHRWGTQGAQPMFCTAGYLQELSEVVVPDTAAGRGRVTDINHPDARFIAASWADVAALLARVDELEAQLAQSAPAIGPTVWQYALRTANGGWLGDIVLRADGTLFALSDWGGFAYRWWATDGGCFRSWLTRLTPDYIADKLNLAFSEQVWPALVLAIRAELAAEQQALATQAGGAQS